MKLETFRKRTIGAKASRMFMAVLCWIYNNGFEIVPKRESRGTRMSDFK